MDFLASEPHFVDHLAPVWAALPATHRGRFHVPEPLVVHAVRRGVDQPTAGPLDDGGLVTVASFGDLKKARSTRRRVVLAEHGAGQSYISARESGSYIGDPDRRNVVAVLVPGPDAADRHNAVHPAIPAYEIGCPKLDHAPTHQRTGDPVVAVAFHWNSPVVSEAKGAFQHYRHHLGRLARDHQVIGHGHPRIMDRLRHEYPRLGIEVVEDFTTVLARADLLACDNSSILPEFAATGRPVLWLDCPHYRRHVHHGGRFWDWPTGQISCEKPTRLAERVVEALADPPAVVAAREAMVERIYACRPGEATERAVAALIDIDAASHVQRVSRGTTGWLRAPDARRPRGTPA